MYKSCVVEKKKESMYKPESIEKGEGGNVFRNDPKYE